MHLSGYRFMWIVTLFDLPVLTKENRRNYTRFRKKLLRDGFLMLQYSVYGRHCASDENAQVHIKRVERNIPPDGEVRVLTVTEKQFEKMRIFWGKRRIPPEKTLQMVELF